jgi:hypothetical protein
MLHPATLGGVRGLSDLHSRAVNAWERAWRGAFMFSAEDGRRMEELADQRGPVVFEALFDGERKALPVKVTGVAPNGLAFFEGMGEPRVVSPSEA